MSSQTIGIIIGGLIPAVVFGVGNTVVKAATQTGIGLGYLILGSSIGSLIVAALLLFFLSDQTFSSQGSLFAILFGLCMGSGTALVSIAIARYGSSISVLTPLYNMNTLVAVLLALWIFSEWKQVHVPQLLIGSLLIMIGGALVARA